MLHKSNHVSVVPPVAGPTKGQVKTEQQVYMVLKIDATHVLSVLNIPDCGRPLVKR